MPAPAGRVSTLDLLGDGLTLFTGPQSARWESGAASAPGSLPVAVQRLDAITARALGIRSGGALLARPDGSRAILVEFKSHGMLERRIDVLSVTRQMCRVPRLPK